MELIIVRHGETEWTISGQHTGITDLPLTPNGRRQAARLQPLAARILDGQNPAVYTSPRRRAVDTAELAFPDRQATLEPLLAEYDYGDYEALTTEQITKQQPGWDIWRDGCPHGESTDEVGARADTFLRQAVGTSTGATVVVVTHGHFSRVLAATALGLAARQGQLFASDTASISVIGDHHAKRCIQLWNMTVDPADIHTRTPLPSTDHQSSLAAQTLTSP
jgi:broad specificity phosphatase PhoE